MTRVCYGPHAEMWCEAGPPFRSVVHGVSPPGRQKRPGIRSLRARSMASTDPLHTIILAGGKGSRMRSRDRHKVCFEVDGVPAIVRAIDAYNLLGVVQNVVVVGEMAGQVVETVGRRFRNVVFVY